MIFSLFSLAPRFFLYFSYHPWRYQSHRRILFIFLLVHNTAFRSMYPSLILFSYVRRRYHVLL
jgi:hypothetical protein